MASTFLQKKAAERAHVIDKTYGSDAYGGTQYRNNGGQVNVKIYNPQDRINVLTKERDEYIKNYTGTKNPNKGSNYLQTVKSYNQRIGDLSRERDDYAAAIEGEKERRHLDAYDVNSGQKRVDDLTQLLADVRSAQDNARRTSTDTGWLTDDLAIAEFNRNVASKYLKDRGYAKYSTAEDVERDLMQEKQTLTQASRQQNAAKLQSDADSDEQFQYFAQIGAGMINPDAADATPSVQFLGMSLGGDKVKNKVSFTRDNYNALMSGSKAGYAVSEAFNPDYMYMTDQQVDTYNYYLGKYGEEKADEYLDSIESSLKYAQAREIYEKYYEDNPGLEMTIGALNSGVDQFKSGLKSVVSNEDYIEPSVRQQLGGMMRQNLAYRGPQLNSNTSLAQGVYDFGTTTANMLPSILASSAIGLINPIAGTIAGDVLMGASAAGNAYQEMLNLGYDKKQARAYSTLTGISEAALQYALGGINKLGGAVSNQAISRIVSKIDNGIAKFAINYGGEMLSEGIEESLQEILDPLFQNAILGTDESVDWEQVVYSGLLGALSAGAMNSVQIPGAIAEANYYGKTYGNSVNDIVSEALEVDPDNEFAQRIKKKVEAGKKVDGLAIKDIVEQNVAKLTETDKLKVRDAAATQLAQYGETGDVNAIADSIAKFTAGEQLTQKDRRNIFQSKYGQRVANELDPQNIRNDNYNTAWAESIGTEALNAREYNLRDKPSVGAVESTAAVDEETTAPQPININRDLVRSIQADPARLEELGISTTGKDGSQIRAEIRAALEQQNANIEAAAANERAKTTIAANIKAATAPAPEPMRNPVKGFTFVRDAEGNLVSRATYTQPKASTTPSAKASASTSTASAPSASTPGTTSSLDEAAKKYGRQAGAFKAIFAPGQNVENYDSAFFTAYTLGKSGAPIETAKAQASVSFLTDTQVELAFEAGRAAATDTARETSERRANSVNSGQKVNGRRVGNVYYTETPNNKGREHLVRLDGMTPNELKSRLNTRQKSAYRYFTAFAAMTGRDIILYDSNGNFNMDNGRFSRNTDAIYVDIAAGIDDIKSLEDAGKYILIEAFTHEFMHSTEYDAPEAYNEFRELILSELDKQLRSASTDENSPTTVDDLIRMRMDEWNRQIKAANKADGGNRKLLDYDGATREVVAQAVVKILPQSQFIKRLYDEHTDLFHRILNAFKEFIENAKANLKAYFKNAEAGKTYESRLLMQDVNGTLQYAQEIVDAFDKLAMQANESFQEAYTDMTNDNGDTVGISDDNGHSQLSIRTYDEGGREKLDAFLAERVKSGAITETERGEMLEQMNTLYDICEEFAKQYTLFGEWSRADVVTDPETGNAVFSVVKANGEYAMNLDFSLICKKRRTLDAVFNQMIEDGIMDDYDMGPGSIAAINDIIRENDFETACALCFVDAKRYRQALVADSFVRMYNPLVRSMAKEGQHIDAFNFGGNSVINNTGNGIDTLPNSELDFTKINEVLRTAGKKTVEYKIAKNLKEHPEDRKLVMRGDFMSSAGFDNLNTNNKRILGLYNSKKGAGGPMAAQTDVQYLSEILTSKKFNVERAYSVGGVRIQSFSDYVPRLVFDYFQMVADLSAKQLPAHAYTKEAMFALQFGLTGIKTNMSLVPEVIDGGAAPGLDANGNYAWRDGQSFGSTVYGGSKDFIRKCYEIIGKKYNGQDRLTAQEGFELAKAIQSADGYTANCGTIAVGVSDEHIRKMLADPDIRMVIPYHKSSLNHIVAVMTNIDRYTDYTNSQNTRNADGVKLAKKLDTFNYNEALQRLGDAKAAADEYLAWCDEHGYIPKFDMFRSEEGYYKLLEDFTCYDLDGNASAQGGVSLTMPTDTSAFGGIKDMIRMGLEEDALLQAKQDAAIPEIVKQIKNVLPQKEAELGSIGDTEDQRLVRVSDPETLSMLNNAEVTGDVIKVYRAMQIQPVDENENVIKSRVIRVVSYNPLMVEARTIATKRKPAETFVAKAQLYSPMAGAVRDEKTGKTVWRNPIQLNEWEMSEGHLERATQKRYKNGNLKIDDDPRNASYGEVAYEFGLEKGGVNDDGTAQTPIPARYNPYIHTSLSALNDQFASANKRPELVTVETLIPRSELTKGFRFEGAKDRVGAMSWHSGPASSRLAAAGKPRTVILSRYDKPVRVVPDAEVARSIQNYIGDTKGISLNGSTLSPNLARELQKIGVSVLYNEDWSAYDKIGKKQSGGKWTFDAARFLAETGNDPVSNPYDSISYLRDILTTEEFNEYMANHPEIERGQAPNGTKKAPKTSNGIEEQYDIRQTANGMFYVQANRQVLYGSDPEEWGEQLTNYINREIRNGNDVAFSTADGNILKLTRASAEKGAFRNVIVDNEGHTRVLTDSEYEAKLNAEAHIDELVQVSRDRFPNMPNRADYNKIHGDFAKYGWRYMRGFFMDFDGSYYRATISVAYNDDGSIVYNVNEMERRAFPKINGSSGVPGAQGKNSSGPIISNNATKSNTQNKNNNTNASTGGSDQSMVRDSAIMTNDRIEGLIEDSGAGRKKDYAQKWITSINPTDFLNLTTDEWQSRDVFDTLPGDYGTTVDEYDFIEGLKKQRRQTPYLAIDKNFNVVGHEGRHRMRALERAGVTRAEIVIEFRKGGTVITNANVRDGRLETIRDAILTNQFGTGQTANISNVIPLNLDHRDEVLASYGENHATDGDIQYQIRESTMSNRDVLELAAANVESERYGKLTAGERDALRIFRNRLNTLSEAQSMRQEFLAQKKDILNGREPKALTEDERAALRKVQNNLDTINSKIRRANDEVLKVENSNVARKILKQARSVVDKDSLARSREVLRQYRDERNVSDSVKKYRKRITETATKLSDWLLKNSDKEHIPEALKVPVAELLDSIDFSSKRLLNGGEMTQKDRKFGSILAEIKKLIDGQQGVINGNDKAVDKVGAYLDISEESREFLNELANTILDAGSETYTINRMNAEQLEAFDKFLRNLAKAIRQANVTLANARYKNIPEMAQNSMQYWSEIGSLKDRNENVAGVEDFIEWKNATPFYAFKRFGEAGEALFDGLTRGWEKFAFNAKAIQDFAESVYTPEEIRKWRTEVNYFTLEDGNQIRMNTAQIMELSQLMNREQARKHIQAGGIRIGNFTENGKTVQNTTHYHLTANDISNIVGTLTEREKQVADKLRLYMADQGGKWGNEISMARFGYEFYTEGNNYYPIKTDANERPMKDTDNNANSMFRLLNLSSSKSLNPNANNALIVGDIFDTFADHMSDMAKLNGLGLPLLDAIKWFNYTERNTNTDGTFTADGIKKAMEDTFGPAAGKYFRTLLQDVNGAADSGDRGANISQMLTSNYKIAAVAANVRVALLQPTSYVRAMYVLDPKNMANALKFKRGSLKKAYNEALQYSGTAVWKSLGYYDTDIARSLKHKIEHDETTLDKVRDKSMILAEKGDQLTWSVLWIASKLQAKADNPTLAGEELIKATADIFRKVIYGTQVMDSTLTRSEIMRGTTMFTKASTAFMAEPTLSGNIIMDATSQFVLDTKRTNKSEGWRLNKDHIGRMVVTYIASAAASAIAESIWDAVRDDDDYETFLQKVWQAFAGEGKILDGNFMQDLTVIGKIPILKNIVATLQGDNSADMSVASLKTFKDAAAIWIETWKLANGTIDKASKTTYYGKMTEWGKIYKSLQALSQLTGIPAANLTRDVLAIWNSTVGSFVPTMKVKTYDPGLKNSLKYSVQDGNMTKEDAVNELVAAGEAKDENEAYWTVNSWENGGKYNKLKSALQANDGDAIAAAVEELKAHGVTDKEIRSNTRDKIGELYKGTDDAAPVIDQRTAISLLTNYGEMSEAEAIKKVNEWSAKRNTGIRYDGISDALAEDVISAEEAESMWQSYGGLTAEQAHKNAQGVILNRDYPGWGTADAGNAYTAYQQYGKVVGMSEKSFYDARYNMDQMNGVDADNDGVTDRNSLRDVRWAYIDSLPISDEQKDALHLSYYKGSTLVDAPWNN